MIKVYHDKLTYLIKHIPNKINDLISQINHKTGVNVYQMIFTDDENDRIVVKDQDDYEYVKSQYEDLKLKHLKIEL